MTTVRVSQERGRHLRCRRREKSGQLLLPLVVLAAVAVTAFVYIGYVLWPRWPTPRLDAPALPITGAGGAFNLPPAAIRGPVQRRPGAQERVEAFARAARSERKAAGARHDAGAVASIRARVHDHRRRRRYACPGRARADHLSALYRRRSCARAGRTDRGRIPRRHALSG